MVEVVSIEYGATAVDQVLRSRCVLADHCPLTAIGLVAPHPRLLAMQQIRQDLAVGDIGGGGDDGVDDLARLSTPICAFMPKYH